MTEHQLPRSGQPDQNTPAPKASPDGAVFLPQGNDPPASGAHSPDGDEEIHLASESVAGEEDPGASLDIPEGVYSSGSSGGSEVISAAPSPLGQAHETPAGMPFSAAKICSACDGSGRVGESLCASCNGSGSVADGPGAA